MSAMSDIYPTDILNQLRGTVKRDEPMKKHVWFGAGGTADLFFIPADNEDLQLFLQHKPATYARYHYRHWVEFIGARWRYSRRGDMYGQKFQQS